MYNLYVVINGKEMEVELLEPYNEKEAQTAMEAFKSCESVWLGLSDGSMLAINKAVMANTYFIVKPIKG